MVRLHYAFTLTSTHLYLHSASPPSVGRLPICWPPARGRASHGCCRGALWLAGGYSDHVQTRALIGSAVLCLVQRPIRHPDICVYFH